MPLHTTCFVLDNIITPFNIVHAPSSTTFTVTTGGVYYVIVSMSAANSTEETHQISVVINGAAVTTTLLPFQDTPSFLPINVMNLLRLNALDNVLVTVIPTADSGEVNVVDPLISIIKIAQ